MNCEGWREGDLISEDLTSEGLIVESEMEVEDALDWGWNISEVADLVGISWTGIEGVDGEDLIEGEETGWIVSLVEEERAWDDGGEVFKDEF